MLGHALGQLLGQVLGQMLGQEVWPAGCVRGHISACACGVCVLSRTEAVMMGARACMVCVHMCVPDVLRSVCACAHMHMRTFTAVCGCGGFGRALPEEVAGVLTGPAGAEDKCCGAGGVLSRFFLRKVSPVFFFCKKLLIQKKYLYSEKKKQSKKVESGKVL